MADCYYILLFTLLQFIECASARDHCDFSCGAYHHCCGNNVCCRYGFYSLWYFWFVMVLVIFSCVLGCGYFKRRQRMVALQTAHHNGMVIVANPNGQPGIVHTAPPAYANAAVGAPPQYPYAYPQKDPNGGYYSQGVVPPPYTPAYTVS